MPDDVPDSGADELCIEVDASATMSREERLRSLDFEQMTAREVAEAKRMLSRLRLPVKPLASRRGKAAATGPRLDPRRTLRAAMRRGGEIGALQKAVPRQRWPNLVVLCDISGSMSQYSGTGLGRIACVHLWHAADQYHPASAHAGC